MANVFILIIGLFVLAGIGVLAVANLLVREVRQLRTIERDLMNLFEDRRDIVPYLLESYRRIEPKVSGRFQEIIAHRAILRDTRSLRPLLDGEKTFGHILTQFLKENAGKETLEGDIGWLEARTELEKYNEEIEAKKIERDTFRDILEARKKQFPYLLLASYATKQLNR